jgi:hypothetical protein
MSKRRSKKGTRTPQPIAGLIDKVMGNLGMSQSYRGWQVVTKWPEIVGEHYAARSRAIRFSDGVLFVAVDDAAWRQELAMQVDEVLKKIRSFPFGRAVSQIRLVKGDKRAEQNGDKGI